MTRSHFLPLLAVAGILIGLVACNSDELPPAGQYASVHGVILDSVTHTPISGATVIVDAVLTTTTDANGAFAFAKVPVGALDFSVQADGHATNTGSLHVDAGKPYELNVSLDAGQPGS